MLNLNTNAGGSTTAVDGVIDQFPKRYWRQWLTAAVGVSAEQNAARSNVSNHVVSDCDARNQTQCVQSGQVSHRPRICLIARGANSGVRDDSETAKVAHAVGFNNNHPLLTVEILVTKSIDIIHVTALRNGHRSRGRCIARCGGEDLHGLRTACEKLVDDVHREARTNLTINKRCAGRANL